MAEKPPSCKTGEAFLEPGKYQRSPEGKETALENAAAEYREAEEYVYFPLAEEMEIESLNLAMTVIDQISAASNQQASSVTQITTGINQISEVIHANSGDG